MFLKTVNSYNDTNFLQDTNINENVSSVANHDLSIPAKDVTRNNSQDFEKKAEVKQYVFLSVCIFLFLFQKQSEMCNKWNTSMADIGTLPFSIDEVSDFIFKFYVRIDK